MTKVDAHADTQGAAYIFVTVEFRDEAGATRSGRVTTIGRGVDVREGAEVAVLHRGRRFALYTPGLGMLAGIACA